VHQRVILSVGQFGSIQNVIKMLMMTQLIAQRLNLLIGNKGSRHSQDYKERLTAY
jgi:hypothetical protein